MRRAIMAAVVAAALTAAAGASAAAAKPHQPNRRIANLTRTDLQLRHRLHNMTIARDSWKSRALQANAQLVTLRSQISGLQAEAAGLQVTVQQRTSERDAARSQAAALQAQLAAIPTPLALAEQQVTNEVAWAREAEMWHTPGEPPNSVGGLTSLAALFYTESHVSSTAATYLLGQGVPLLPYDANAILAAQLGDCTRHTWVFRAIMHHFGYQVRSVHFAWDNPLTGKQDGHTAAEVYYDGGWHYFDTMYGTYWKDASGNVLSITDARAGLGVMHKENDLFINIFENTLHAGGDDTDFELAPTTIVALGQWFSS